MHVSVKKWSAGGAAGPIPIIIIDAIFSGCHFFTNAVFLFPTLKQQRVTREHTKSLKTLKIDVSASSQMKKKRNRFTKNGRPDWGGTEGESSQHIATKNANKEWEAAGGYRPK